MSTSIEENISLGAVDSTAEQVLWAGDLAGVSEFANRHPDGYKLKLREQGESLSGDEAGDIFGEGAGREASGIDLG